MRIDERAIRPVALRCKNHLFSGSDRGARRWSRVCALFETAKFNAAEPYAYLADVLGRMTQAQADSRHDEILP